MKTLQHKLLLAVLMSGIGSACCATNPQSQNATSSPAMVRDCFWDVTVKVWHDANNDGLRDKTEKALPDVVIWAKETPSTHVSVERLVEATSDATGTAKMTLWLAGCPKVQVSIQLDLPEGFQLAFQDDALAVENGELVKTEFNFGLLSK